MSHNCKCGLWLPGPLYVRADGGPTDVLPEPGASPVEFAVGGAMTDALRPEELWVDEAEGTIAARWGAATTQGFFFLPQNL